MSAVFVADASCPACSAPLAIEPGHGRALCVFCSSSWRGEPLQAGGFQLERDRVASSDVERITSLLLDGRRRAAIDHYARASGVPEAEARAALAALGLPERRSALRDVPLTPFGMSLGAALSGVLLLIVVWAFARVGAGRVADTPLLVLAAFALARCLIWLLPKAAATLTARFGTEAGARVLQRKLLCRGFRPGASLVFVLFEVEPPAGGAAFLERRALLVQDRALARFEPGSQVRVRYREPRRTRVFPVAPARLAPGRSP